LGNLNGKNLSVIGGDVNSSFDVTNCINSVQKLKNILRQHNFIYTNVKPTRGRACLDNVFTNINRNSISSDVTIFPFSDHDSVWLDISKVEFHVITTNELKYITSRPINDDKISYFRETLCNINWLVFLGNDIHISADKRFEKFMTLFLNAFNHCIPLKTCKVNNKLARRMTHRKKGNNWFTSELASMKNRLMLYLDLHRKFNTEQSKTLYLRERKNYKFAIK